MTREELSKIVSLVADEVKCESSAAAAQRAFGVENLREQVGGFVGGDLRAAWEISYKTNSAVIDNAAVGNIASRLAWEISYKTSSVALPQESEIIRGAPKA